MFKVLESLSDINVPISLSALKEVAMAILGTEVKVFDEAPTKEVPYRRVEMNHGFKIKGVKNPIDVCMIFYLIADDMLVFHEYEICYSSVSIGDVREWALEMQILDFFKIEKLYSTVIHKDKKIKVSHAFPRSFNSSNADVKSRVMIVHEVKTGDYECLFKVNASMSYYSKLVGYEQEVVLFDNSLYTNVQGFNKLIMDLDRGCVVSISLHDHSVCFSSSSGEFIYDKESNSVYVKCEHIEYHPNEELRIFNYERIGLLNSSIMSEDNEKQRCLTWVEFAWYNDFDSDKMLVECEYSKSVNQKTVQCPFKMEIYSDALFLNTKKDFNEGDCVEHITNGFGVIVDVVDSDRGVYSVLYEKTEQPVFAVGVKLNSEFTISSELQLVAPKAQCHVGEIVILDNKIGVLVKEKLSFSEIDVCSSIAKESANGGVKELDGLRTLGYYTPRMNVKNDRIKLLVNEDDSSKKSYKEFTQLTSLKDFYQKHEDVRVSKYLYGLLETANMFDDLSRSYSSSRSGLMIAFDYLLYHFIKQGVDIDHLIQLLMQSFIDSEVKWSYRCYVKNYNKAENFVANVMNDSELSKYFLPLN